MDKKTFLKTSATVVSGIALTRLMSCNTETHEPRTNWAGNLTYSTDNLYTPGTIADVQKNIKNCRKLRALGSKHSFNKIADSKNNQVSTGKLNKIISLDKEKHTVTVEAGIKYGELCTYLDTNGFALHNLASLPHISISGACSTSTHGSGIQNGSLATAISAIEFVNAAGDIVSLSKEKDGMDFFGAVVGLGAIGLVTRMTLELLPKFKMKQVVYQNMSMSELEKNFETIMSGGYSVSLFINWKNKNINQVWIKSKIVDNETGGIAAEF